jgi:hypothetical protein
MPRLCAAAPITIEPIDMEALHLGGGVEAGTTAHHDRLVLARAQGGGGRIIQCFRQDVTARRVTHARCQIGLGG